jgi:hypothetical protein
MELKRAGEAGGCMNRDEQKTSFISAVVLTFPMPHHKHVDRAYIEPS